VVQNEINAYSIEKRFLRKDNTYVWISLSVNCVRNGDNSVKYFVALFFDISERKKTEEALGQSEEKFWSILENSADAIFITDMQGKYLYVNIAAVEMLKISKHDFLQKTIIDVMPVQRIDEYLKLFNSVIEKGKIYTEIELLKNDGSIVEVDLNAVVLPGSMIFGSCRDISDRKRYQSELIMAKTKAEESDRLKTAFLHNISHEIRTPLNAIVGFSSMLTEPHLDDITKKTFINSIVQSSDHLLEIIKDIIEVSNIEAGITKLTKDFVNLNLLLRNLQDQFITRTKAKNIQLILDTPLNDESSIIFTDKTKLIQIYSNLLSNALKFTDAGIIKFGYLTTEKGLNFYVSDTGIGIEENQIDKIFDRFYQVQHSLDRNYEGTGIGLSITKSYVEIMGGSIWVMSELSKGSTFNFTISSANDIPDVMNTSDTEFSSLLQKDFIVLLAEDDENNYQLIKRFLNFSNFILHRVKNGLEAVQFVESGQKPDIILMDIRMPVMDGYDASKKIKKLLPEIPIIAQTALIMNREKILNSGCSNILTKPFGKKDLLSILRSYLVKD
jgi:PAS domain S-box-containing protein